MDLNIFYRKKDIRMKKRILILSIASTLCFAAAADESQSPSDNGIDAPFEELQSAPSPEPASSNGDPIMGRSPKIRNLREFAYQASQPPERVGRSQGYSSFSENIKRTGVLPVISPTPIRPTVGASQAERDRELLRLSPTTIAQELFEDTTGSISESED